MAEIVKENEFGNYEDGSIRVVRLSGSYGYSVSELYVQLYENGTADFLRVDSEGKSKKFRLLPDEVCAFIEAWQQMQTDHEAWKEAEKQREQAFSQETMTLAQEHGIEVTPVDAYEGGWNIHCEVYHKYWSNCTYAESIQSLRASVDHIIKSITAK